MLHCDFKRGICQTASTHVLERLGMMKTVYKIICIRQELLRENEKI